MKTGEKRHFSRIALKVPIRYQIRGTSEFNNAILDNIGLGGIGFIHHKFVTPQTVVEMEINILSRFLSPLGRITRAINLAHSDKYRLGIEFLELDPIEKNYLQDFIDMQMGKL